MDYVEFFGIQKLKSLYLGTSTLHSTYGEIFCTVQLSYSRKMLKQNSYRRSKNVSNNETLEENYMMQERQWERQGPSIDLNLSLHPRGKIYYDGGKALN